MSEIRRVFFQSFHSMHFMPGFVVFKSEKSLPFNWNVPSMYLYCDFNKSAFESTVPCSLFPHLSTAFLSMSQ